jgi:predicted TIM-barrel fold metal-dependent hydrolase
MMFGSDWPVALLGATYKEVVHVAETLSSCLSKAELNHFWSQTAANTYGIEIPSVSKDKTKVGYEMGLGWP